MLFLLLQQYRILYLKVHILEHTDAYHVLIDLLYQDKSQQVYTLDYHVDKLLRISMLQAWFLLLG